MCLPYASHQCGCEKSLWVQHQLSKVMGAPIILRGPEPVSRRTDTEDSVAALERQSVRLFERYKDTEHRLDRVERKLKGLYKRFEYLLTCFDSHCTEGTVPTDEESLADVIIDIVVRKGKEGDNECGSGI